MKSKKKRKRKKNQTKLKKQKQTNKKETEKQSLFTCYSVCVSSNTLALTIPILLNYFVWFRKEKQNEIECQLFIITSEYEYYLWRLECLQFVSIIQLTVSWDTTIGDYLS